MKRGTWRAAVALFALTACGATRPTEELTYTVDLNDRADDQFKVSLAVDGLTAENALYQFAATAPGTYQVMDIGRFVRNFAAFDAAGNELQTERVSTNQWQIHDVELAREIRYSIAETWDTPVDEHSVYMMAGTSIEDDHVLLNAHAVFGYPTGMQDTPVRVRLEHPAAWDVGTALNRDPDGAYLADDYDHLVDSPILLGRLSVARTEVTGVPVEIFTYSKTDVVKSEQLLAAMGDMLNSAGEFLGQLPVDRYTFLYHFEDVTQGAWEHSLSSEYVFREMEITDRVGEFLTDIAAHEFFHVVTPLNVHSEIIEQFNFVEPVPSEHLWLYEGTTEWAAHVMQLRSQLKSPEEYLQTLVQKMLSDLRYDTTYSLSQLALTSFTDSGQAQYGNIYQRGALVAGLLDIRLLELSDGEVGLQNLINELARRYGKDNPFPEAELFDIITDMTYPEVGEFFGSYVRSAEPLPMSEYYAKLGIDLIENEAGRPVRFDVDPNPTESEMRLRQAWMAMGGAEGLVLPAN